MEALMRETSNSSKIQTLNFKKEMAQFQKMIFSLTAHNKRIATKLVEKMAREKHAG